MIDFRSDTVTKPTRTMREAMMHALVGDDVYEDDPTVNELEALAAQMTGKEAALFVPSGTMGNQIAIMAHTKRGDEIIVGGNSHIKNYEVGAAAVLSGVSYHLVDEVRGMMDIKKIKEGIRGEDIHYPDTSLICLENAHGTGVVAPLSYMKEVYTIAQEHGLFVHTDGARVFNAAAHLGESVQTLAQYTDSMMFCLSKGLASPVGSMLVGTKAFIKRARKMRKMLGGGMRQAGIIAASGIVSLTTMVERLERDHSNASALAKRLNDYEYFTVDMDARDINMVFFESTLDLKPLEGYMKQNGILLGGYKKNAMRLVCHNDISIENIEEFFALLDAYLEKLSETL